MATADFTNERPSVGYYRPTPAFAAVAEHVCLMREDQPGGGTPLALCGPAYDEASEAFATALAARWNACPDAFEKIADAVEDEDWIAVRDAALILRRAIYGDEQ